MLEETLAKKLIERVSEYTSYNVNIMNEDGIIIASVDPKRVGTFHEAAYVITHNDRDVIMVEDSEEYEGTAPGINMVIQIDGKRIGVVGVSGKPEEIRPVANITKMAVEVLIKYERQKLQSIRRQTKKERFIEMITSEDHADPKGLRRLAEELQYREDIIRIPILCCLEQPQYQKDFLESVKKGRLHKSEDISFALDEKYILIFKTMDSTEKRMFAEYKYILAEYLQGTLQWMQREGIVCRFYIGTFQDSFLKYHYAYRHCRWLEKNTKSRHNSVYFYDHICDFVQSIVPEDELDHIFNVYRKILPEDMQNSCKELINTLVDTNFNTAKASEALYMHKNTFLYQYNKIRDVLNVNPQSSYEDKWFLIFLQLFLRKK